MDRKTAESYVLYGIKSITFSKKLCTILLPFNILLLVIAVAMFHEIYFAVIIFILLAVNIGTSIIYRKKWSVLVGFLSQATQALLMAISFDLICFSMYKITNLFVLYEYLILIIIQLFTIAVSSVLVVKSAKKHDETKKPEHNNIAGPVTALSSVSVMVFGKLFIKNASFSIVITILGVLMNVLVCLCGYAFTMGYYRAFLIKKFNLDIDLENI